MERPESGPGNNVKVIVEHGLLGTRGLILDDTDERSFRFVDNSVPQTRSMLASSLLQLEEFHFCDGRENKESRGHSQSEASSVHSILRNSPKRHFVRVRKLLSFGCTQTVASLYPG